MKLGEIVKDYRTRNHLTMQEFADRCDLSKGFISMLEKGQHPQSIRKLVPSLDTVGKIATGMGMDVNALIDMLDDDFIISVGGQQKTPTTENDDGSNDLFTEIYNKFNQLPDDDREYIVSLINRLLNKED